jgi:hypothetical protein
MAVGGSPIAGQGNFAANAPVCSQVDAIGAHKSLTTALRNMNHDCADCGTLRNRWALSMGARRRSHALWCQAPRAAEARGRARIIPPLHTPTLPSETPSNGFPSTPSSTFRSGAGRANTGVFLLLPVLPPALLALADGTVFTGHSIGAAGHTVGEVVFNTALTGYQEILTDPATASRSSR